MAPGIPSGCAGRHCCVGMFVARAISRSKWEAGSAMRQGAIPADAVTGDLRTSGNVLSFWQCDAGTGPEVEEVALAIASGRDHLARIDLVWLRESDFLDGAGQLIPSEGRTPVAGLAHRHRDLKQIDYEMLGRIARAIRAAIDAGRFRAADEGHRQKDAQNDLGGQAGERQAARAVHAQGATPLARLGRGLPPAVNGTLLLDQA